MPELADIKLLFERGRKVILFHGDTKRIIGESLKRLTQETHFGQFIKLLEIFQMLATSIEYTVLNIKPIEENYNLREQQRLKKIYHFVEQNYQHKIDIKDVIALCNLSNAAFCRYFKKMTQMTFTEFLNQYRINQAQKLLLQDYNVTETCFLCGFENLSYFNKSFKKRIGENPTQFKKKHLS